MKRFLLLMAVVSCGPSLLLFSPPEIVHAQTRRTDTIYFMGATRGNDYNNSKVLSWCVSQSWHLNYVGGLPTALDEVAQQKQAPTSPYTDGEWWVSCHSDPIEKVDLTTYSSTSSLDCRWPCFSLFVRGSSAVYADGCDYIEIDFYDYATWDNGRKVGDFKGKQRMIHALAPNSTGFTYDLPPLRVTSTGLYASTEIGMVQNDTGCHKGKGFTPGGYHVHHDLMPPTIGNCVWALNPLSFSFQATDRQKQNSSHWVHLVAHTAGISCVDPGPKVADSLVAPDGALDGDGNGAGTKALATGAQPSVTSPPTCIPWTSWCGTITATPPVLQAAFAYYRGMSPLQYFRARQSRLPPPSVMAEWYNDGTAFFQVRNFGDTVIYPGDYYVGNCPYHADLGEPIYIVSYASFTPSCTFYGAGPPPYGAGVTRAGVNQLWAGFRGWNGVNPTVPPTQTDANTWAQTQIGSGHWWDVVQPALDAMIRAAGTMDMATLGITGNPPFDGNLGQVGLAGMMNKMNTLASWITRRFIF